MRDKFLSIITGYFFSARLRIFRLVPTERPGFVIVTGRRPHIAVVYEGGWGTSWAAEVSEARAPQNNASRPWLTTMIFPFAWHERSERWQSWLEGNSPRANEPPRITFTDEMPPVRGDLRELAKIARCSRVFERASVGGIDATRAPLSRIIEKLVRVSTWCNWGANWNGLTERLLFAWWNAYYINLISFAIYK